MTASAFFKETQYRKQKLEVGPAAQKNYVFIEDFYTLSKLRIWSHLLKKPLMENFLFRAVLLKY